MAASSIRFGPGATREVGMDCRNLGFQRVALVTDATVDKLDAMAQVRDALAKQGIPFQLYADVVIEPKDKSCAYPFSCSTEPQPSLFLAVR